MIPRLLLNQLIGNRDQREYRNHICPTRHISNAVTLIAKEREITKITEIKQILACFIRPVARIHSSNQVYCQFCRRYLQIWRERDKRAHVNKYKAV